MFVENMRKSGITRPEIDDLHRLTLTEVRIKLIVIVSYWFPYGMKGFEHCAIIAVVGQKPPSICYGSVKLSKNYIIMHLNL